MRQTYSPQLQIGQTPIELIQFDLHSRDDILQILQGLQYLYVNLELRHAIFAYLQKIIPAQVDPNNGRPGMDLWNAWVLGTVRLTLNCDYDRITELANEHLSLRQMLGHGLFDAEQRYALQTVKDNVYWFTPEVLDGINQIVVKAGHRLLKQDDVPLRGRCDSFVVETDVHFPTDINLLRDAVRTVIRLCGQAGELFGSAGWRQSAYQQRYVTALYRRAQNRKASHAKNPTKVKAREQAIRDAHADLIDCCAALSERAGKTLEALAAIPEARALAEDIQRYRDHVARQIDQIERRVLLKGETIPHAEKVFSVFQEHTEGVCKGKAGVPVELGVRVCILEDQMGFILHHRVMEKQTDEQVSCAMVTETQSRFPNLNRASFDKGFYTPENRRALQAQLDLAVMPKKGRLSQADRDIETADAFVAARRQHSAVASAINALENHGLDLCRDHGIAGFKRYVAFAVVARNVQILGAIVRRQKRDQEKRDKERHALEQRLAA